MFILIAQLNLESNHIQHNKNIILIKNKILWHGRTRQVTRSVNDLQVNMHSVYSDQGAPRANRFIERKPLVWLYKATSD
jgi:hypothetical protein